MNRIKPVTLNMFLVAFSQAQAEHSNSHEPIPDVFPQSVAEMKYILQIPFTVNFGKTAYWGFHKKAAVLFYQIIKKHPLANGNKRMAIYTLAVFYEDNERDLKLSSQELYDLAYFVVNSDPNDFENIIDELTARLKAKK